ncbi:D-alanyl-D-alanine dipeptidase [Legionella lansingensis]|uniref:D-alanyl-D-alanine dipeptidase n=1 Tax=Legionella lansingensis TaxID=45067 RepID=A0A0W0VR25_9GAMM|nr:M15 family metallopeptidase [Legionella lansingensis]KTD22166.1 D-alanyl-D-alanine dipeptidase [Legionella lansingensis]SNV54631.1 D-alanyl-D-alanine dipeptidase [Legionella lansingensis]
MHRYFILLLFGFTTAYSLPKGFVYLDEVAPNIIEDMRYAGSNNFVGHPIPGYKINRCILTLAAAKQLANVEKKARAMGYGLKIYDCYRPQRAVNAFYRWSQVPRDNKMKAAFYPREEKNTLFAKGYIAKASGHSRGSTVDLTLIKLGKNNRGNIEKSATCYGKTPAYIDDDSIDTGTRFDCFDVSAHTNYQDLTEEQKANRLLLRNLMLRYGFVPYKEEWWHFRLRNEPYPHTYFDFPVQ